MSNVCKKIWQFSIIRSGLNRARKVRSHSWATLYNVASIESTPHLRPSVGTGVFKVKDAFFKQKLSSNEINLSNMSFMVNGHLCITTHPPIVFRIIMNQYFLYYISIKAQIWSANSNWKFTNTFNGKRVVAMGHIRHICIVQTCKTSSLFITCGCVNSWRVAGDFRLIIAAQVIREAWEARLSMFDKKRW